MAVNGTPAAPPITGRVESVNEKGVKVDGAWHNYSRFADGIVAPERGAFVTLTVDRQGFVRAIDSADGSAATPSQKTAQNATSARDTTITRLAVLKAAAEYCASKQASTSSDVLKIASAWEAWVNRPSDADELEIAF